MNRSIEARATVKYMSILLLDVAFEVSSLNEFMLECLKLDSVEWLG